MNATFANPPIALEGARSHIAKKTPVAATGQGTRILNGGRQMRLDIQKDCYRRFVERKGEYILVNRLRKERWCVERT